MVQFCNFITCSKQLRNIRVKIVVIYAVTFFICFCLCRTVFWISLCTIVNYKCTITLGCSSVFDGNSCGIYVTINYRIIICLCFIVNSYILFNCKRNVRKFNCLERLACAGFVCINIYFYKAYIVVVGSFSFECKALTIRIKLA